MDGVLNASASHLDHTATVTYDTNRTNPDVMMETLAKNDFPVERMRFLK